MAITLADFNKIWASTSPLTPYSFSESNYKQGWNFIGSTPPARQMWDFLQKQNDEKMQYIVNNYAPITSNAGSHNSVYRGNNLGTSVTAEQYAEISAGTFRDMYIGDYWYINNVAWFIAAFDFWFRTGDTECSTHHVAIIPQNGIATCKMNSTNITTGGYVGSDFYTGANGNTGKSTAITAINNAFGSSHILTHREYLSNAVTDGKPSGASWYDSTVDLMSEIMVYGSHISGSPFAPIDKSQLPLFALEPSRMTVRLDWWLRDIASSTAFSRMGYDGRAGFGQATFEHGVRPIFGLKA